MAIQQKPLHVLTEILGVISGVYLIDIADKVPEHKVPLRVIGITTLLVDAYFITTWYKNNS